MDEIITYLVETYSPSGIIVYGSFANGTSSLNSDFDALLIYDGDEPLHDHSIIHGTQLDVFLYPKSTFENAYAISDFIRVWDGQIVLDRDGLATQLKERAAAQIRSYPGKSIEENRKNLAWCEKMLARTERADAEGLYRLHWLLVDSLEIYFDLRGLYYFGPKKAIRQLQQMDPVSADTYYRALKEPTRENLADWIRCLIPNSNEKL